MCSIDEILYIVVAVIIVVMCIVTVRLFATHSSDEKFATVTTLGERVGSDTQDIHGVYGTVEQKKRFPRYSDLVKYGRTTVAPWEEPQYVPSVQGVW